MSELNRNAKIPEKRLDDESRVKVLSPSMLVMKRFARNRLAITGTVILVVMFVFSFIGAVLSPYTQTQVFYKYEEMMKDYASVMLNDELRYIVADGETLPLGARAQFILAINNGKTTFSSGGVSYSILPIGEDQSSYRIAVNEAVCTALGVKGRYTYSPADGVEIPEEVKTAFEASVAEGENTFTLGSDVYTVETAGKNHTLYRTANVALASMRVMDVYEASDEAQSRSFLYRLALEEAIEEGRHSFAYEGAEYTIAMDDETATVSRMEDGAQVPYAISSPLIASAIAPDIRITVPFKEAILDAIGDGVSKFEYPDPDGTVVEYELKRTGNSISVKRETLTQMIDMYHAPSGAHWMGTDGNGMDMLTRLMYGGRVSLMVGFVVVLIEVVIGVLVGGVAGYFGGKIDTLCMRFIDLFNCIPYYALMIITGSVMDKLDVDPLARIFILMLILGLLNWTGIARVVRGQILTLREQDFMVATEATGIKVSRRIFKHLVPNVMPLLIVQGTMSLGSVIITEATLSFLGLGLKYPMASWGTIINAATDMYVMQNYWFIWLPAGSLILLTVLGFNFVGDGLRDAFDPKMKR